MVFPNFVEQFPLRLQPILHLAPLNTTTRKENLIGTLFDFFAAWIFPRFRVAVLFVTFPRLTLQGLYCRNKAQQRIELSLAFEVSPACCCAPFHSPTRCRSRLANCAPILWGRSPLVLKLSVLLRFGSSPLSPKEMAQATFREGDAI